MTNRSGVSAQAGFAEEGTYGTIETPDRFLPLISESLTKDVERMESEAIRPGRLVLDAADWASGLVNVGGDVVTELYNNSIGLLLKHAFGAVQTTGSDPYTHTFTPNELFGLGLTFQIGRPGVGGTVHPFTYEGCKVAKWTIDATVGQIARFTLGLIAQDETTATESLASASYATLRPFTFVDGSLTIAGSAYKVKSASLTGENMVAARHNQLGSAVTDEPIDEGLRTYGGTIDSEFVDLTAYNRFINGATAALVLEFDNGTDSLTVTMAAARFDGTTPQVSGRGIVPQSLPFKAVGTTDAAGCTAVLINTDENP